MRQYAGIGIQAPGPTQSCWAGSLGASPTAHIRNPLLSWRQLDDGRSDGHEGTDGQEVWGSGYVPFGSGEASPRTNWAGRWASPTGSSPTTKRTARSPGGAPG